MMGLLSLPAGVPRSSSCAAPWVSVSFARSVKWPLPFGYTWIAPNMVTALTPWRPRSGLSALGGGLAGLASRPVVGMATLVLPGCAACRAAPFCVRFAVAPILLAALSLLLGPCGCIPRTAWLAVVGRRCLASVGYVTPGMWLVPGVSGPELRCVRPRRGGSWLLREESMVSRRLLFMSTPWVVALLRTFVVVRLDALGMRTSSVMAVR